MVTAVDSSTSSSTTNDTRKIVDQNYQDFLLLLTTQLKNQDPTNPTDTNQLTQQIATLSQVEQQLRTNDNLEKLITLFGVTQYNSVVSYIGKQIEATGNAGALQDGEALFAYYLDNGATDVTLNIKNSAGNVVYTGSGTTLAGRNNFVWNGKDNAGTQLPDGTYTIEVEARDSAGGEIAAKPYTTGIVTSVDSLDGTVYLSFGDIAVPVTSVISVREPTENSESESTLLEDLVDSIL